MRERGGARRDPGHGAAAVVQVQLPDRRLTGGVPGQQGVDALVGQSAEECAGEVVLGAGGPQRVEQALHGGVGHGAHQVGQRLGQVAQRFGGLGAVLDGTGVHSDDSDDGLAVGRLGQERHRRRDQDVGQGGELVGHGLGEVAPAAEYLGGVRARVEDRAGEDGGADRVQAGTPTR